eukprot:c19687_g1_i1 orf=665-1939(+)
MARGRKFKRGGAKAKPEVQAANTKPEQEVADTPIGPSGELEDQQSRGASDVPEKEAKGKSAKENRKRSNRGKKPVHDDRKGGVRRNVSGSVSRKRADEQVVDFSGLIFMCNTATKKDCFKHHVFGFPEAKKDIVARAKKGMKLFLFDIDQRVLYGVYKASSLGGMNLVSEAFQDSERKFPAQIRFQIHKDCAPLDESDFKPAIKENYFGRNKFKCELSYEQVGKLLKLFRPLDARGLPKPKSGPEKESRRESFHKGSASRGPRTGVPARSGRSGRQPPSAGLYTLPLVREPLPIELGPRSQPGYLPARVLSNPGIGRLEADALYRQRFPIAEALDRRAYALDPLMDASLRQVGVSSEFTRRRFADDLHVDERSLLLSKGSLLHEDPYREAPYQRDVLYSGRDDGYALAGALPYKPLTSLPWGYP